MLASADEYSGGLLDDVEMMTGVFPDTMTWRNSYDFDITDSTTAVTDNDANTFYRTASYRGALYTFAVPHDIDSYILLSEPGYIGVIFYDINDQVISMASPYTYLYMVNNSKTNIVANGVKKVIVFSGSGTRNVYEFNIFGKPSDFISPPELSAVTEGEDIVLSWNSVGNADSYNVKRALIEGGPYVTIATTSSTTYRDTNVQKGITYYYIVTAHNATSESDSSNEATATLAIVLPEAPVNLSAVTDELQVELDWDGSAEAVKYNVKRSLIEGGPYTVIGSVYGTRYTDTNVENGVTYYYVVAAENSDGESDSSNEVSATPTESLPEIHSRALLTLYLIGGQMKEHDVSLTQLDSFLDWFDKRAEGIGQERYGFEKTWNLGPFKTRVEYVVFGKIITFDIDEYELE